MRENVPLEKKKGRGSRRDKKEERGFRREKRREEVLEERK